MSSRRLLGISLALVLAIAGAIVAWRAGLMNGGGAGKLPPLDLSGLDPAVAASIGAAKNKVDVAPGSADAWGRLAMLLDAHHFSEEALVCYGEAEHRDPGNPRWPYHQALLQMSRTPEAGLPKLRRAVELAGDSPDMPRLRLADLLLLLEETAEAEALYRRLLDQNPEHGRARLGLARLAYRQNKLAEALQLLEPCLLDPYVRQSALALRAEIHTQAGDPMAAQRDLAEIPRTAANQSWPDPWLTELSELKEGERHRQVVAVQLVAAGRAGEAIPILEKLTQDYPKDAANWMMLGYALIHTPRPAAAESPIRRSLELDPNQPRAWLYLGIAQHQRGDRRAAISSFRAAVDRKPDYAVAYFNLGATLKEEGDFPAAIEAFRDTLRCQPGHVRAHASLGELLVQANRPDEAMDHLRQAVERNPGDAASRALLDEILKGKK